MKILGICGSASADSYTLKALKVSLQRAAALSHETELISISDLRLPLPDAPDSGSKEDAQRILDAVKEASGVILATPEYHGSYSSGIKLIIDNLGYPSALKDKPISLLGTAAGKIGAIKALEHLSSVCSHVGAFVTPGYVSIPNVRKEFSPTGEVLLPATQKLLEQVTDNLLQFMKYSHFLKSYPEALAREGSSKKSGS
jgi:FMN reductase